MQFLSFLGILLPFVGIGAFLLFIIALMNEKGSSRGEVIRSAFTYVVTIVLLGIVVSSSIFLVQRGLKAWVFKKAEATQVNYTSPPPSIYLSAGTVSGSNYTCSDSCQFTAADKDQLVSWRGSYEVWKQDKGSTNSYTNVSTKRDIASAFSFLLVALPLFLWFFLFMVQREWKQHKVQGGKPGPLRSTYFDSVAFIGLIGMVVSGALLINVGMKSMLGVQNDANQIQPTMVVSDTTQKSGVQSIINCSSACGFSADDKALAEQWLKDNDTWQKNNTTQFPSQNDTQADLANYIPILLVTLPLFFFHFLTIRRESKEEPPVQSTPISA